MNTLTITLHKHHNILEFKFGNKFENVCGPQSKQKIIYIFHTLLKYRGYDLPPPCSTLGLLFITCMDHLALSCVSNDLRQVLHSCSCKAQMSRRSRHVCWNGGGFRCCKAELQNLLLPLFSQSHCHWSHVTLKLTIVYCLQFQLVVMVRTCNPSTGDLILGPRTGINEMLSHVDRISIFVRVATSQKSISFFLLLISRTTKSHWAKARTKTDERALVITDWPYDDLFPNTV